jgi:predicted transcriptional regulator
VTDRTTIRLPEELKGNAMRLAAEEGRTLTSLIEEALRRVIAERRHATKPKAMPRASKARGWLAPGIKDLKEVQELEDLVYVERLRRL